MIKLKLTSVVVDDQAKAEKFYTDILGFRKKQDFPIGGARWLTVVSPASDEAELLLEPCGYDFAQAYQKALYERGIPCTAFAADNVQDEYERLREKLGVVFRGEPQKVEGFPMTAVFEDTCGNLIQLYEL